MTITELNRNIPQRERKIRAYSKSIKRVKVTFQVQVYTIDMSSLVNQWADLELSKANKLFKILTYNEKDRKTLLALRPAKYRYQLIRFQSSGYLGGIILGSSREVIQDVSV